MAMTLTSRKELYKLREIVHLLLHVPLVHNLDSEKRIVCAFCRQPLHYDLEFKTHGNAIGPKLTEKISIHHVDGDHKNDVDTNKALSHRKCHKSYHRSLSNKARAAMLAVGK